MQVCIYMYVFTYVRVLVVCVCKYFFMNAGIYVRIYLCTCAIYKYTCFMYILCMNNMSSYVCVNIVYTYVCV